MSAQNHDAEQLLAENSDGEQLAENHDGEQLFEDNGGEQLAENNDGEQLLANDEQLLADIANMNNDELQIACSIGKFSSVRQLVSNGASLDYQDADGYTPSMFCCIGG